MILFFRSCKRICLFFQRECSGFGTTSSVSTAVLLLSVESCNHGNISAEECNSPHFINGKMETRRTSAYHDHDRSPQRGGHMAQGPALQAVSSPPRSFRALLEESGEELETSSGECKELVTSWTYRHSCAYQCLKYCTLWTERNWTAHAGFVLLLPRSLCRIDALFLWQTFWARDCFL